MVSGRVAAVVLMLAAAVAPAGATDDARPPPTGHSPATSAVMAAMKSVASSGAPAFRLPLPPPAVVLTPFEPPATRYGPGHRGVDLAGPIGGVVVAAGAGTVAFAGDLAGRGVVSIRHPSGLRTTYEPVTATVVTGAAVSAGDPIGVLEPGHASCAPASCLHWGARLPDGGYLDPMALLGPWRVRLLPWEEPP